MVNLPSSPSCRSGAYPGVDDARFDEVLLELKEALKLGIDPSLDGIVALCEALGRPQDRIVAIQVTGTNGKTSTSRMIAAILRTHGAKVGLYTSPELIRYPERMEVDGRVVSDELFARAVATALEASRSMERPVTEFELLTAAALWLFDHEQVDFAVLEVGIGGTWDSTSVVAPAVAVVTGVSLDHQAMLGDTVEEIAHQKSGIIKPASAPVLGPGTVDTQQIFLDRADQCDTHARVVREVGRPTPVDERLTVRYELDIQTARPHPSGSSTGWTVDVHGAHGEYPSLTKHAPAIQALNIATAVAACEAALGRGLDCELVASAVRDCPLPGRFDRVCDTPVVIVDGSHNPEASAVLAGAIADAFPAAKPIVLLGVLGDKDARGMVEKLNDVTALFAVTRSENPRALPVDTLAEIVRDVTGVEPEKYDSVAVALEALLPRSDDGLVITGSLSTAGEAKRLLIERETSS